MGGGGGGGAGVFLTNGALFPYPHLFNELEWPLERLAGPSLKAHAFYKIPQNGLPPAFWSQCKYLHQDKSVHRWLLSLCYSSEKNRKL